MVLSHYGDWNSRRQSLCLLAPVGSEDVGKIPFVREYTIITQHWGIMVGLMGVFMIVAAFKVEWRKPILIYSLLEKAFMVYLVLANGSQLLLTGFQGGCGDGRDSGSVHDRIFRSVRICRIVSRKFETPSVAISNEKRVSRHETPRWSANGK